MRRSPWVSSTNPNAYLSAESIPRPSRSNFTSPASAQSSLSHWSTVRPGMRAHSTGHTSITGRSHSTMPPGWTPRWRGRRMSRSARSRTGSGMWSRSWVRRRLRPDRVALGRRELLRLLLGHAQGVPPVDGLGPRVLLPDAVAERLRGVPDGGAGAVLDDVRDHRRVDAPEPLVDVLDDLLAAVGLDVHVDVGRPVPLGGEEALEQQPVGDGVDGGYPERVADGGVGGRAAPLAQDVVVPAELDQVVDDEEVAREVQRLDHLELAIDLRVRALAPAPRRASRTAPAPPCTSARAATTPRGAPRGRGTAGGWGRRARGRRRGRRRGGPHCRPPRGGAGGGGASPRPSAGARRGTRGASRPCRRATSGRGRRRSPPRGPRRAGSRSGRSSWRPA